MQWLLREEMQKGGDFCGLVVDLAIEVANNIVLESLSAAKQIGLEAMTMLYQDIVLSADSACTVAHRGMQQLLDGELASMDSSSTIDLSAGTAGQPSGTHPLHNHANCTAECFDASFSTTRVPSCLFTCRRSDDCLQEAIHSPSCQPSPLSKNALAQESSC
jgi:hypothetical protein